MTGETIHNLPASLGVRLATSVAGVSHRASYQAGVFSPYSFIEAPELDGSEPWLQKTLEEMDPHLSEATIEWSRAGIILILRALPYEEYLQTIHWAGIRWRAMDRYRGQCLCGKNAVDGHHTNYSRKGFERPEDVVALCRLCHTQWHRTWRLQARESLK